jgi:hypothetical protein
MSQQRTKLWVGIGTCVLLGSAAAFSPFAAFTTMAGFTAFATVTGLPTFTAGGGQKQLAGGVGFGFGRGLPGVSGGAAE